MMLKRYLILLATLAFIVPACASPQDVGDQPPAETTVGEPDDADEQENNEQQADEQQVDEQQVDEQPDEQAEGFDARLTGYEYPYDVEFFEFDAQRYRNLEMAYMDVSPAAEADNGEVVLLLHGKNFSGAYWASTIEALIDEGFRVIVPDQIGFGKSSKPRHYQYTFQALASYTDWLLEEVGVEDVHVVGHSMGGMLASRFALMFPAQTLSLTLVNPIGLEDWKRKVPYRPVEWWYANELDKTPEGIKGYMTESYFDGQWKSDYDPLLEIQAGWTQGPDYERIAWNSAMHYDMIFTQPVLYEFDRIQAPTLLIIGARDRTALGKGLVSDEVRETMGRYPEISRQAAEAIPNARLELLENIGHVPQYEAPARYEELLTGFLSGGTQSDSNGDDTAPADADGEDSE